VTTCGKLKDKSVVVGPKGSKSVNVKPVTAGESCSVFRLGSWKVVVFTGFVGKSLVVELRVDKERRSHPSALESAE
jgi:hypothetical protein